MSRARPPSPRSPAALGTRIARVLRGGTLVAVATVVTGFVLSLLGGEKTPGGRPVIDLITRGDADALTAAGLLGLTLLPLGVLAVAAATFGVGGERRYLVASLATLGLLLLSLGAAALVARAG